MTESSDNNTLSLHDSRLGDLFGRSRRGYSHQVNDTPCQDAIKLRGATPQTTPPYFILSVADGHGDSAYDFSKDGATYATRAATRQLYRLHEKFLHKPEKEYQTAETRINLFNTFRQHCPQWIISDWRKHIIKEVSNNNSKLELNEAERQLLVLPEAERNQLDENRKNEYHALVKQIIKRHGTTLLTCLVTPQWTLIAQLGDGDCVIINSANEIQHPIPDHPDLSGNLTHSLSQDNAILYWRTACLDTHDIHSVLLATDGLSDSYPNRDELYAFIRSLYQQTLEFGVDKMQQYLPEWLDNCSKNGSGDDASLACVILNPPQNQHRQKSRGKHAIAQRRYRHIKNRRS